MFKVLTMMNKTTGSLVRDAPQFSRNLPWLGESLVNFCWTADYVV